MARKDPQMNLRIPADIKQQVEDAARANGRSGNAEVVLLLQEALAARNGHAKTQEPLELTLRKIIREELAMAKG